ncbi:heterogeneous nuclear ribonucleoprotein Q-like [Zingiber officinale]|uniref:heterogeneous nuclear ribonucleoprotein Q-like n=1 Tax=Zingiber officinale TaxID=94328 RepID=UPI001C4D190B|nr:heterogeneous nuclear ribonucleoprotein Q-like [Zingiber officinale]
MDRGSAAQNSHLVEEVFRDIKGRRVAIIRALTTNFEDFYQQCDLEGFAYLISPTLQSMAYGRGQIPTGMPMVPMVLPDGRLGYVLQQPEAPVSRPQHGGKYSGSSSGGQNNDSGCGRRYKPY